MREMPARAARPRCDAIHAVSALHIYTAEHIMYVQQTELGWLCPFVMRKQIGFSKTSLALNEQEYVSF